jgi:hypothetical protein
MHRPQSAETRGSKGMSPLNRRLAPPIRDWRPSKRIRISNLCPLLFLDSDYLDRLLKKEGNGLAPTGSVHHADSLPAAAKCLIQLNHTQKFT